LSDNLGMFEFNILQVIVFLGDDLAYGAKIFQKLEEIYQRPISIGSVYTALGRLTRRGFLRSWYGPPCAERGGRSKRFYAVTVSGETSLKQLEAQQRAMQAIQIAEAT
jgi:PadR family transcriptional regulator PadR